MRAGTGSSFLLIFLDATLIGISQGPNKCFFKENELMKK